MLDDCVLNVDRTDGTATRDNTYYGSAAGGAQRYQVHKDLIQQVLVVIWLLAFGLTDADSR